MEYTRVSEFVEIGYDQFGDLLIRFYGTDIYYIPSAQELIKKLQVVEAGRHKNNLAE